MNYPNRLNHDAAKPRFIGIALDAANVADMTVTSFFRCTIDSFKPTGHTDVVKVKQMTVFIRCFYKAFAANVIGIARTGWYTSAANRACL